jgi:hypothetical protein
MFELLSDKMSVRTCKKTPTTLEPSAMSDLICSRNSRVHRFSQGLNLKNPKFSDSSQLPPQDRRAKSMLELEKRVANEKFRLIQVSPPPPHQPFRDI